MHSVSIIGLGRIGGSLAIALARAGFVIRDLVGRRIDGSSGIADLIKPPPRLITFGEANLEPADIIIVCTSDPEIKKVSEQLSRKITFRPVVLHTSGSLSSGVLEALAEIGCSTGSLHPLVSISEPVRGASSYAGAYFCVEGDDAALEAAKRLAAALGGRHFTIGSDKKSLYHAAAIMASGNVAALFDAALEMMQSCGIERADAKQILLPLLVSMVENLRIQGPENAITGSFARGDFEAFERHWKLLLSTSNAGIRRIFLELGERSLTMVERKGEVTKETQTLRNLINMAKAEPEC